MDNPWQLCQTIGPLVSQRFPLASAKAQPRGDLLAEFIRREKCLLILILELSLFV